MRPATERDLAHELHPQEPPPAMLTRTDVFRGGMVILLAVVIGAFLLSQGLDEPDLETIYTKVKRFKNLDPRGRAVLSELARWREESARARHRTRRAISGDWKPPNTLASNTVT